MHFILLCALLTCMARTATLAAPFSSALSTLMVQATIKEDTDENEESEPFRLTIRRRRQSQAV